MNKFWDQSWFLKVVSLLIAILLVIYIDNTQTGFVTKGEDTKTQQTASETITIKVPLRVSVDTDKYYVVGYPEKVKITLEGSNALVTSAVNTQNFRVYIDLTNKTVGTHVVNVHVSGLSRQISYALNPKKIKVNIQLRKSRSLPVQIEYNKNAVANGYEIGKTSVDPSQVEVTGSVGEVNHIDRIVAKVTMPNGIKHDYERQVILIGEDKAGYQLNVVIQPSTARVTVPISLSQKKVKVVLDTRNEDSEKVYSLTAKQNYITIYGTKATLAKISKIDLPVDLAKIKSSTVRDIPVKLPTGVVSSDPKTIRVQIKVKASSGISKG
ncbi:CdaR family protein [Lactobacillus gigeriorum]|uniref:YbbR n=1 Tax=Lactobacillus gigeriorum DSM 23908 = CRBIP 24.85 TaxID=1423751 RepID=I7K156_9LACO|nr:CdaR family protein [Lactobacillus gigeriorum]KRN14809.1 hypothetical protein FC38_GL000103 [Lactobacillus gigeriorum DSM 23908 = CRBIP 24.85]CCI87275.1 YbbR [Lactobacillus gigeriorum DSM 23908 = CRBIP 24.85]